MLTIDGRVHPTLCLTIESNIIEIEFNTLLGFLRRNKRRVASAIHGGAHSVRELLPVCISPATEAQPRNPPERAEQPPKMTSEHLVLSFLACCVRRRGGEGGGRLSAKQQDGRAMATLDRQIPSLDTFLCEPWSSFVSAAKLRLVDGKFDRLWRCFRGETVGKCAVQLSVIELSKLFPPCSVCFCQSAAKVSVKKNTKILRQMYFNSRACAQQARWPFRRGVYSTSVCGWGALNCPAVSFVSFDSFASLS